MLTPTNPTEDFHDDDCSCEECHDRDCECFDCEDVAERAAYDLMECQIKESLTI